MTEAEIQKAISDHERRNAELMRLLESKGSNPLSTYRTEHHFWAYTHDDAVSLAQELYKRGYLLLALASGIDETRGTKYWNVEASFERTLADAASRAVTEELVRLAARFSSEYDGWGVSV